jgi:hypothetical protein
MRQNLNALTSSSVAFAQQQPTESKRPDQIDNWMAYFRRVPAATRRIRFDARNAFTPAA